MAGTQNARVAVFIDGSNFYHRLKDPEIGFEEVTYFHYRAFAEWLARGRDLVYCGYYVGTVREEVGNPKSIELRRRQQRLFAHLQSPSQRVEIQRGYILKGHDGYHEKGVNVKLAVDLIIGAYENLYDAAIVVSSDTDLLPAMQKAKQLGKAVEYIGFSHRPSFAMQRYANLSRLLIRDELMQFAALK